MRKALWHKLLPFFCQALPGCSGSKSLLGYMQIVTGLAKSTEHASLLSFGVVMRNLQSNRDGCIQQNTTLSVLSLGSAGLLLSGGSGCLLSLPS